jgi:hypothetical protein
MLDKADEVYDIAARSAPEAVKALGLGVDVAGRCPLGMKRAGADIISARALYFDIRGHYAHYVVTRPESVKKAVRQSPQPFSLLFKIFYPSPPQAAGRNKRF